MKYTSAHRILFIAVVLASFALFASTAYRSVPFWESGEYYAAVQGLGNTHPPAAPFFLLIANVISLLAPLSNPALQYNLVNAMFAALTVGLLYLLGARVTYAAIFDKYAPETGFVIHTAGVLAALTAASANSFWGAALQLQAFTFACLFSMLIVWLGFVAYDADEESSAVRILLLIAFLLGLGTGVHWSVMYAVLPVIFLMYFRYYYFTGSSFAVYMLLGVSGYVILRFAAYAVPGLGGLLFGASSGVLGIAVFTGLGIGALGYAIYIARTQEQLVSFQLAGVAGSLFLIGYTVFIMAPLRAGKDMQPNYGRPETAADFAEYASKDVPGKQPPILDRTWSDAPEAQSLYAEYDSPWDYFVSFQIEHMFFRYIFWNFIGKSGDALYAPAYFGDIGHGPVFGSWAWFKGAYPLNYFAIPFILGIIGMLRLFAARPVVGVTLFLLFGVYGFWMTVVSNIAAPIVRDNPQMYLVAIAAFTLWIAAGVATVVTWIVRSLAKTASFDTDSFRTGMSVVMLAVFLIVVPGIMLSENYSALEASDEYIAQDFAYNLLQTCDENAILFTAGDNDTFPLRFMQEVMHIRRDVSVVNLSLLNTGWYSREVKNMLRRGKVPARLAFDDRDIEFLSGSTPAALMRTAWPVDQKIISFPVTAEVIEEFTEGLPKGMQQRIRRKPASDMAFVSMAQFPFEMEGAEGIVRYFRPWKDVMVEEIVRAGNWKRPVYFAVTCPPEAFIGMDDFLRLDGMAYRVTPLRYTDGDYVHYASLIDQLLYPTDRYSTSPKRGFMLRRYRAQSFRSGEEVHGVIGNYRNAYMQLAKHQRAALNSPDGAIATLNAMGKFIPDRVFPLDYHYAFDIGQLYREAGAGWRAGKMMERVEAQCLREIRRDPENVQSIYSPYRYLFELYLSQGRIVQARDLLARMEAYVPDAADVKRRRAELDSLLANQ